MPLEMQTLHCPDCDGTMFLHLTRLKHKPGSGLVEERAGWQCVTCATAVDASAMLRSQELRAKRDELRQLEIELGIEHATEPTS